MKDKKLGFFKGKTVGMSVIEGNCTGKLNNGLLKHFLWPWWIKLRLWFLLNAISFGPVLSQ